MLKRPSTSPSRITLAAGTNYPRLASSASMGPENSAQFSEARERHGLCRELASADEMPKKRTAVERARRGSNAAKCPRRPRTINIVDWRTRIRPAILRKATTATIGFDWSQALFATLLEELGENDSVESLLGPIKDLDVVAHPQAVALALILRHSWQPHHLRRILESLELIDCSNIG